MEVTIKKPTEANASIVMISAKVGDLCTTQVLDENGHLLADRGGYPPSFLPIRRGSDYLRLEIDLDTGRILNWGQISRTALETFIDGDDE